MNHIYILLGSNLGNPISQLQKSIELLTARLGLPLQCSSIYESEAWGVTDQPIFYNQVILLETAFKASECLSICQEIENQLGRIRTVKWGARLIDIDILYYNNECIHTEDLQVPHPYLHQRNFTLVPLTEIAAEYIHPKFHLSNYTLLKQSTDTLKVKKVNS
ncbi:2-amino-4-hydroxy-6-hydroxymethyldihydropteridine diphosphokinase [Sphingobacterium sp. Mn56C]|uniref:2-amino-4-hydroxy-6- hydroxymethyldihydropteridine diphosphokinase n=1 Tax=Sphingobacterium sp. Mn56C TaxID=3395261 RepID=UPI003BD2697D